jgi:hypothetical protein
MNNATMLWDVEATALDPLDDQEMLDVYNVNTLGTLRVMH